MSPKKSLFIGFIIISIIAFSAINITLSNTTYFDDKIPYEKSYAKDDESWPRIWIPRYNGTIDGINWSMQDWYNAEFNMTPPPENEVRYANGTVIKIEGEMFTIEYSTDVFLVYENDNLLLKRHFQIIFMYFGSDNKSHSPGLDFRGFAFTTNVSLTEGFILQDNDGVEMCMADFSYTNMSITHDALDNLVFSWNVTFTNYTLINKEEYSEFYGSRVSMDLTFKYTVTVTQNTTVIDSDWFITFTNVTLPNVSCPIYMHTGRVYACSDEASIDNESRIGSFYSGGIRTSAFRLEPYYYIDYANGKTVNYTLTSMIMNDAILNGEPEPNEYWGFFLWFEGINSSMTSLTYDPELTLYLAQKPPEQPSEQPGEEPQEEPSEETNGNIPMNYLSFLIGIGIAGVVIVSVAAIVYKRKR